MKQFLKTIVIGILTFEAKCVLARHKPKIVGVTGSVGKTSTKDAIFKALGTKWHVRKSEKSFNSEIGVPLTILGCHTGWNNPFIWLQNILKGLGLIILPVDYPKWLVLEVGADRPGDIETLTKWIKPDVAVITRFGDIPVHVEFFKTRERLVEEKKFLVKALKEGGTLVVNGDDADARSCVEATDRKHLIATVEGEGDVRASSYQVIYKQNDAGLSMPTGISFNVDAAESNVLVSINGVVGKQHIYSALLALGVASALHLNLADVAAALSLPIETPGRMKLISGIKHSMIIDDTYNSSPVALFEAVRTLGEITAPKRKIAILGDMMELGTYSKEAHEKAGQHVASIAHILITVGLRSRDIAEGALQNGMDEKNVFQFDDAKESLKFLDGILGEGDIILVKGSQFVRLERVVEEIMENPLEKEALLVRQDPEWLKR